MAPDRQHFDGAAPELIFQDIETLAAAYVPFFQSGGLFMATAKTYRLGEEIGVRVGLPGEPMLGPVPGRVAWITPAHAIGNRVAGVGLHFANDDVCRLINKKIAGLVAGMKVAAMAMGG